VLENLTFPAYALAGRFRRMGPLGLFDRAEAERYAAEAVRRYGITCASLNQPVRELSGGNQQKVAVAKGGGLSPTVLVVCEPTRGVDLRTKRALLEWFAELNREEGMTIVICSGEPEDLVGFCSRIAVLREGQVRRMRGRDADEAALLAAMEMDREADGDGAANGPECGGGLVGAVPGAPEARR
jgi:ABC-type sugar transport system ATPase subunit